MRTKLSLDYEDARHIAAAGLHAAAHEGVAVSIAVVDDTGELLHLIRMDDARGYTADLATRKARAAVRVGLPTSAIEASVRERQIPLHSDLAGAGGVPLRRGGECAGAVGVSGASAAIDERIAEAGCKALGDWFMHDQGTKSI
jgi:glc operon protein GlcG